MDVCRVLQILEQRKLSLLVFLVALGSRLFIWWVIPVDWNWDSYHHWQISYYSLKIGFAQLRLWDLNGCEYFWGMIPHIIQAVLLGALSTSSILPYRLFNTLLGCINSVLVQENGATYFTRKTGLISGLAFAVFPIAAIFDVLAMQDTVGLTFLLASLSVMERRPFWSGVALALTGQSRTEYLLVGFLILIVYGFRERLRTESLPFIFGWISVTMVFSIHVYSVTGNPVYALYINLWNIFGGFNAENRGRSFTYLMFNWVVWKLRVWPTKPTGWFIIGSALAMISSIAAIVRRRWVRFQPQLYFITTLAVLSPIFVTYLGSDSYSFLIMLRMINPIVALLCPLMFHGLESILSKSNYMGFEHSMKTLIVLGLIFSYRFYVPFYSQLQQGTIEDFRVSEIVLSHYETGTLICDYPTMNYFLINAGGLDASSIQSNHYSPDYYGESEPVEYLQWLKKENVTIWIYKDYRAEPVWCVLQSSFPEVIELKYQSDYCRVYLVDQIAVNGLLNAAGY